MMNPDMLKPDPSGDFVALLASHERRLATYVMTLCPHWADAEEILQETKMVMWREFARFTPGTNFGAWACAIAFHRVLAHRKKLARQRLRFDDEFIAAVAQEIDRSADHLEHRARLLADCLAALQPVHRRMIQLRYSDAMSIDQVAQGVGRSVAAVYRALSRIRRTLHECVTTALTAEARS
jgi:RNA polymerase sigma-70 factor (ECF subfamily)